jgi:hypothetical protein
LRTGYVSADEAKSLGRWHSPPSLRSMAEPKLFNV